MEQAVRKITVKQQVIISQRELCDAVEFYLKMKVYQVGFFTGKCVSQIVTVRDYSVEPNGQGEAWEITIAEQEKENDDLVRVNGRRAIDLEEKPPAELEPPF